MSSAYMENRVAVLRRLASEAKTKHRIDDAEELDESATALQTMIDQLDACVARAKERNSTEAK